MFIYSVWIFIQLLLANRIDVVNQFLTSNQAELVKSLFTLFGYENMSCKDLPPDATLVFWGDLKVVGISDSCNALILFVIFAGFILAYPASFKPKTWFIPIGLIAIFLVNVIRIFLLALIFIYYPQYLDFNHHYTFTVLVYLDIYLLWLAYVKRYGKLKALRVNDSSNQNS